MMDKMDDSGTPDQQWNLHKRPVSNLLGRMMGNKTPIDNRIPGTRADLCETRVERLKWKRSQTGKIATGSSGQEFLIGRFVGS